jgi:hypothetical protein
VVEEDSLPVDTGRAVVTTQPSTSGTTVGTSTTDPPETADTGDLPFGPVEFERPARSVVLSELCDDDVPGLSWFELFNVGGAAVDIGDWRVRIYADASLTGTELVLPHVVLPPDQAFVVIQPGYELAFDEAWFFEAQYAGLPFELDGDDAVLLFDGEELVDAYGVIGEGLESDWTYAGRTATRYDGVNVGSAYYQPLEWARSLGSGLATPGRHPSSQPLPPTEDIATTGGAGALILTEVVDHLESPRLKYVEVTNVGAVAIDLSSWVLSTYADGSGGADAVAMRGELAAGASYVVASADGADAFRETYGFDADLYSSVALVNGNDAITLSGPFGQLDTLGVVGVDGLGTDWDYTDAVYERVPGVLMASPDWISVEWSRTLGSAAATPGSHSVGTAPSAELLISEVVHHALDPAVRWLELYNPGPATAPLGRFSLHRFANGSPLSAEVLLSGSLAAGETYVVAGDGVAFTAMYGFDADFVSSNIDGDGNDTYQLRLDGVVSDIYGEVGTDGLGTDWEYTGAVVVRDPLVTRPRPSLSMAEWRVTFGAGTETPGVR